MSEKNEFFENLKKYTLEFLKRFKNLFLKFIIEYKDLPHLSHFLSSLTFLPFLVKISPHGAKEMEDGNRRDKEKSIE